MYEFNENNLKSDFNYWPNKPDTNIEEEKKRFRKKKIIKKLAQRIERFLKKWFFF